MSSDSASIVSQITIDNSVLFAASVLFVTRIPLIVADLLVLVLTWMKTYRQYREARALNIKSPLTTCLIHDGTVYFFILLALNVAQILSLYVNFVVALSIFTSTMPQILICRFMMNLRQLNLDKSTTPEVGTSQQLASLHTLTFNNDTTTSFMGNMGEPLDYNQDGRGDNVHVSEEQPDHTPHTGEEPDI
ncbi:uncharacterized protein PHACADRAFT_206475 [Phanerochaete carnosa HHB-10118-sp]|uniref:Uncharacterized protein n=1 Tax=Phanerochaete carnosa (strain HHB-10118-sp) TaxID=650164 RepID=K5W149_PHACS|nr:uncharacterized protein PHACADRAFT_206475 [Phanerochaete carnosa HHB-10118-sp]EKM57578.1 hypothetical protein PHACADRAFT_206475 [Phanerochaete carnosa HHB-10118-sp]